MNSEIWPGIYAHPTGAIWIPETSAVLIADLHLGYGWAQRRRGELGPVDEHSTRSRIQQLLSEFCPREVVLLGDIVHAPKPAPEERAWIESILTTLKNSSHLICVRGNHDRKFLDDFGVDLEDSWRFREICAFHGDRLPAAIPSEERWILGHWHPAIRIEDAAGASRKLPAFFVTTQLAVMPAFSPFAAGIDVWKSLPEDLRILSGDNPASVIAITGKRAIQLGPLARLRSASEGTHPGKFRRPG